MSRTEFLQNLGILIMSAFGAKALLNLLIKNNASGKPKPRKIIVETDKGYGGRSYGN